MGGFVAGAALGTMNFLKYRQATDDYDATLAAYYQNPSTASYSKLTAASDDKTKYQQQTQILFGAAVGFYVWGIVDAFIWGGGEADGISLLDRPNRRIELVAAPGRVGVGVRF